MLAPCLLAVTRAPSAAALSRSAVCMNMADEAAARQAWLERTGANQAASERAEGAPLAAEVLALRQREREEARKRMLAAMGTGGTDQMRRGAGEAFGFGAADDEDYGYGPPPAYREPGVEIDLLTGKPSLQSSDARGDGFDGRMGGWSRRPDMTDPNPPPMANTLRAPGQAWEDYMRAQAEAEAEAEAEAQARARGAFASSEGPFDAHAARQDQADRNARKRGRYARRPH